ncbi:MAG: prepilin-type N-terminal cleavage/methylation domain-containing protein [Candidatus Aminicenantes bacterium]|nr:prepilin-type N-terminal cleavage/methylation domain-containing protein [Candidatus Aminicenantes bacterium]
MRRAFTLTEILVTAAILAVLAAAAVPLAQKTVQREREIELSRALREIREAVDAFKRLADEKKIRTESGTEGYPPDLRTLVEGVELLSGQGERSSEGRVVKLLRRIPKDPMTRSTDWGLRSYQDKPDASSWGGENVYDVYTKSRGRAMDGSLYREW